MRLYCFYKGCKEEAKYLTHGCSVCEDHLDWVSDAFDDAQKTLLWAICPNMKFREGDAK